MKIKHKLLSDYQFISDSKIITLIKAGTIIENYIYKDISIDKEIIDSNPQYFEIFDWKNELVLFMKMNKIPQPAVLSKKLIPFINDMIVSIEQPVTKNIDTSNEDRERLKEKEQEYELRNSRLERREQEYLDDIKSLRNKEESYRADLLKLSSKELELQQSLKSINEKQRQYDIQILESLNNDNIDQKYKSIEDKITQDYNELANREEKLQIAMNNFQEELKEFENLKASIKDYNLYLDERLAMVYDWKEKVLNNWNYALYPIQEFPIIEKRDFS